MSWEDRDIGHREFVAGGGTQYWLGPASGEGHLEVLKELGLKPNHRVLDVGCGSLRIGRWLIDYLKPERYYGIDPNLWLVEMARMEEVEPELWEEKLPTFSSVDTFDLDQFKYKYDFILISAVLVHAGDDQIAEFLNSVPDVLKKNGTVLGELAMEGEPGTEGERTCGDGWTYPSLTAHLHSCIEARTELKVSWFMDERISPRGWFTLERDDD